jgi:hypothetical protein
MAALTLLGLETAFKETLMKGATPHRAPDFDRLRRVVELTAPVMGRMWFIEEHNTGYDGVLFRWQFSMPRKDGSDERVSVWADLLPGLIHTDEGKDPEPLVEREGRG